LGLRLKLKQEDLRNEVMLTKDDPNEMAWHKAAEKDEVEILEKICDRAKKLQLKPKALRK
jgi:DNA-binding Xre family transcriptional regulator